MTSLMPSLGSSDSGAALRLEFDALLSVCARLSEARPVEDLLAELLLHARRLTHAEAGAVFLADKDRLRFVCTQNDSRPELENASRLDDRRLIGGALGGATIPIDDSSLAGYSARHAHPLRLDDVYLIPDSAPYRFDKSFDVQTGYRCRSMLVAPLLDSQARVVGVIQVINRRNAAGAPDRFTTRDQQIVLGLASLAAVSVRNAQMRDELARSHLDTILRLATAAEFRDGETSQHIRRVSLYCETVARAMGSSPDWARLIMFASPMHDVGKLGVPDAVLRKPGKLTPDERAVMETHTTIGAKILAGSVNDLIRMAERIALAHHEKWDGTGYPNKIAGDAIPLEARIVAIADVFDALTSRRVYKPPFSLEESLDTIAKSRGQHFDPDVVDAFTRARDEIAAVHEAYAEPAEPAPSAA